MSQEAIAAKAHHFSLPQGHLLQTTLHPLPGTALVKLNAFTTVVLRDSISLLIILRLRKTTPL